MQGKVTKFITKTKKLSKKRVFLFCLGVFVLSIDLLAASIFIFPKFRGAFHSSASAQNFDLSTANANLMAFSDVSSSYQYATSITFLKNKGILVGYKDGTFNPDGFLTRAEFMKLLVLSHKASPHVLTHNRCFDDVSDEWFASYVCFAKGKGWIHGYDDGKFYPGKNITEDDAINMIFKSFNLVGDKGMEQISGSIVQGREISRGKVAGILASAVKSNSSF
jgi:hypothetical protein